MNDPKQAYDTLEKLVDRYGLKDVLSVLAGVCAEKADHIQVNWQDAALAKQWTSASRKLDTLKDSSTISTLPK